MLRLRKATYKGYQPLDAEQGNIQTNKVEMGACQNKSVCRPIQYTTRKLYEYGGRTHILW